MFPFELKTHDSEICATPTNTKLASGYNFYMKLAITTSVELQLLNKLDVSMQSVQGNFGVKEIYSYIRRRLKEVRLPGHHGAAYDKS